MIKHTHILVVDDEVISRQLLEILLKKLGYQVSVAADGVAALEIIRTSAIDLLVTDLMMPDMDGLALLTALRAMGNNVPVIVITAGGSIEAAVEAMKQGVFDFIKRPVAMAQLEVVVNNALKAGQLKINSSEETCREQKIGWDEFIGESKAMLEVYDLIRRVAPSKANVLISGETGTGKELVARAIHRHSGRTGMFIPINCAAIPSGLFESELFGYAKGAFTGANKNHMGKFEFAHKGTIFLDEITEMPVEIQARLLRVLQESTIERLGSNRSVKIDTRIIAATNRNPREAIAEGCLRQDLFYRLNVFNIGLPALRERSEDVLLLANNFNEKYRKQMGYPILPLSADACDRLNAYSWPGNVRELENIIERAVVLSNGSAIEEGHLPHEIVFEGLQQSILNQNRSYDLEGCVSKLEIRMINSALQNADGNKAKAARSLKISERTLWYKLKKHHISPTNLKP